MGKMILKKEKIVLIWKCFNISYRYILSNRYFQKSVQV